MDVAVRQSPHIGPKQAKVLILSPLMSGRKATIWLAESTELVLQYKSILSMKLLAEAQRGQSIEQNDAETAKIYTKFAQIAEQNEKSDDLLPLPPCSWMHSTMSIFVFDAREDCNTRVAHSTRSLSSLSSRRA